MERVADHAGLRFPRRQFQRVKLPRARSQPRPAIAWFRNDLRLADNRALLAAVRAHGPVIPVFVWAPDEEGAWPPGAASCWWLHQSLGELSAALQAKGSRLILRAGPTLDTLRGLIAETQAALICWNQRGEPGIRTRDAKLEPALRASGCEVKTFCSSLLHEPANTKNQAGKPFQVFTPFWKHCLDRLEPSTPLPAPARLKAPASWPTSLRLAELKLEPVVNWAGGLRAAWQPGEKTALKRLRSFLQQRLATYEVERDRPDLAGTSTLSPYLHFGEISPRQIWHALQEQAGCVKATRGKVFRDSSRAGSSSWRQSRFLTELGWREFAHYLLYHFPDTDSAPLRAEFSKFPWRSEARWLRAWQRGLTGYPFVDAGMRQLWTTGWMHNRVRMVVASFLVKDLLIPWQEGTRWFWDTLVDADLAQNTLGWQWAAGCGADAAPFFRIFNPVTQGEKFDPAGTYVRRWLPEIGRLPNQWIHKPYAAPAEVLAQASIILGETYPEPIVSHSSAREVALEAYAKLKRAG